VVAGRVTVMVPSYNYAQYLSACVESAASQPDADVVIVDNGSTDDSPAIGASLADRHENVRFVRHERNEGIITSFNRCRDEVRGDYALLLCADDLLAPGALSRAVAQMDAHPHVGLLYGTAIDFTDSSAVRVDELPAVAGTPVVHEGGSWVERLCRTGLNPIRTPEAMFRSSVFADAGPYEPACRYTSDLNLWLRIAARADVLYLRGPVQAMFRQHEANEGKAFPHNSLAELEQRWTAYDRFFAAASDDPRRRRWEELARATVASEARYSASRVFAGATPEDADALLAFADRLQAAGVAERAGWALRRKLGPRRASWFPGFHLRPVVHRLERMRAERRRDRLGVA
jgi:glycosyltransferase involved in cell wall biosynthesis